MARILGIEKKLVLLVQQLQKMEYKRRTNIGNQARNHSLSSKEIMVITPPLIKYSNVVIV